MSVVDVTVFRTGVVDVTHNIDKLYSKSHTNVDIVDVTVFCSFWTRATLATKTAGVIYQQYIFTKLCVTSTYIRKPRGTVLQFLKAMRRFASNRALTNIK